MIQEMLLKHVPRICLLEYTPGTYTHPQIDAPYNFCYVTSPRQCITNTGITSFVNDTEHLLLLDFTIPVTADNTKILRESINHKGLLVNSGNSYHFYSYQSFTIEDWKQEMYKALLLPGIDFRYIGHRLINGYGNLRITRSESKPVLPVVLEELT